MRCTSCVAAALRLPVPIIPLVLAAMLAGSASATYHPRLGRFCQRDPAGTTVSPPPDAGVAGADRPSGQAMAQYADGAVLYQYVAARPCCGVDPSGLWGAEAHESLTEQSFKEATAESVRTPNPKARQWVLDMLIKHNKAVDDLFATGQVLTATSGLGALYQWDWHYLTPTRGQAARYDRKYERIIRRERRNVERLLDDAAKSGGWWDFWRDHNCRRSLEIIANLTHAHQDFYMHAMVKGSTDKVTPAEKAAGVQSSYSGWILPDGADPDNRSKTEPASWNVIGAFLDKTTHPQEQRIVNRPGYAEPIRRQSREGRKRYDRARAYVTKRYTSGDPCSLKRWFAVCWCWAKEKHGK